MPKPKKTMCRVSVTKNESPNCTRDRSLSGLAFNLRGLPSWMDGEKFRVVHDVRKQRLFVVPSGADVPGTSVVTVRRGHVQSNIKNGRGLCRTPKGQPPECPLIVVLLGGNYRAVVVDLIPAYKSKSRVLTDAVRRLINA